MKYSMRMWMLFWIGGVGPRGDEEGSGGWWVGQDVVDDCVAHGGLLLSFACLAAHLPEQNQLVSLRASSDQLTGGKALFLKILFLIGILYL